MTLTKPTITTEKVLTEEQFYNLYFELQNVGEATSMKLSKQEITVATILCIKPLQLLAEKSQHGKSEKYKLASALKEYYPNFQTTAIYGILGNLGRKGVLVKEASNLVLNPSIQGLRNTIKKTLRGNDSFEFTYGIDFVINAK